MNDFLSEHRQSPDPGNRPPAPFRLRNGLPSLILALGVLAFIMYVLAPLAIRLLPPLRDYANVVNETGIMPGALYYSDVPQTVDGEFNNRDAIRFRVHPGHADE